MATFKIQPPGEINVPRSFTPESVDTSRSNLIQGLGQAVGVALQQRSEERGRELQADITKDTEKTARVVATVEEAMQHSKKDASKTFDSRTGTVNYSEEYPKEFTDALNTVMKESGDEFRSIASAVAQGSTPKAAAAIQLESKLREYTARYPSFAPELRQTMRDNAGYDPTGYHMRKILDINDATPQTPLTESQKLQQKAEALHDALSVSGRAPSIDVIKYRIASAEMLEKMDAIKASEVKGNIRQSQALVKESITQSGPNLDLFFAEQETAIRKGGTINVELQQASLMRARAVHETYLYTLTNQAGDYSQDTSDMIRKEMDRIYEPVSKLIGDAEYGKILAKKNIELLEIDKRIGRSMFPELMMIKGAMGAEFASKAIDHMMAFSDPKVLDQYAENYPVLRGLIDSFKGSTSERNAKMANVYTKVVTGQSLEEGDLEWAKGLAPIVLDKGSPEEGRQNYLNNLGKEQSAGVGWLSQKGRRIEAPVKDVEWMKREWKDTVPALINSIAKKIAENPALDVGVTKDGKFQMSFKTKEGKRPVNSSELSQLQYFVNAVNNGWAYDFGITPSTVIKDLSNKINQSIQNYEHVEQPSIVQSINQGIVDVASSTWKSIQDNIKDYEDRVTGKKPNNDPNKQFDELLKKLKSVIRTDMSESIIKEQ